MGSSPPRNFQIFLKSEGKEVERKRDGGGEFKLIVSIFFGIEIFF